MLFVLGACNARENNSATAEDIRNPYTPPRDSLEIWCTVEADLLTRVRKEQQDGCDLYYLGDVLYTGWACQMYAGTEHKYRYTQFEQGKLVWQIGYYDSGQLDADFRMQDCKNSGSSRMWLADGSLYIDEYYSPPGIKQGVQKQWHANTVLAREAEYESGKLVYEERYDTSGNLIGRTGLTHEEE